MPARSSQAATRCPDRRAVSPLAVTPSRAVAGPPLLGLQRLAGNRAVARSLPSVQRNRYWYASSADPEDAKDKALERALVRDNKMATAIATLDTLRKQLTGIVTGSGNVLIFQCHGTYRDGKATNLVIWEGNEVGPNDFMDALFSLGFGGPKSTDLVLDLFACFTAGSVEEWSEPGKLKFDFRKTFVYLVAQILKGAGYTNMRVRGYVGETRIAFDPSMGKRGEHIFGAGVPIGKNVTASTDWHVDVDTRSLKISLGAKVAKLPGAGTLP